MGIEKFTSPQFVWLDIWVILFTSRPISCLATIIFLKIFSIFIFIFVPHFILTPLQSYWFDMAMDFNEWCKILWQKHNYKHANLHLGLDKWFCFVLCFSKTAIKMSSASSLYWWELWVNLKSRNMASCLANTWLTLLIFSSSPLTSATGVCVHSHTLIFQLSKNGKGLISIIVSNRWRIVCFLKWVVVLTRCWHLVNSKYTRVCTD